MNFHVIGQQKSYLSPEKSALLASELATLIRSEAFGFDVWMCPSFVNLARFAEMTDGSGIGIGAQNFNQKTYGPHTGQVALEELVAAGARLVILGHSETRSQLGETYEMVNQKLIAAVEMAVAPVVCFGDSADDKKAGRSEQRIRSDVETAFRNLSSEQLAGKKLFIAYDPPWAIKSKFGDAQTEAATPDIVASMHGLIRRTLKDKFGSGVADSCSILYGGSVEQRSAPGLIGEREVNGLLVGSASTQAATFRELLFLVEKLVRAR